MDLRTKLARLNTDGLVRKVPDTSPTATPSIPTDDPKWSRIAQLRSAIARITERERRAPSRARPSGELDPLPGETRETRHGPVHVVERVLEPHHCHGKVPLAGALAVDASHVAALALDRQLAGVDLRRMLLVDTETTGLNGGTGTLAFLIGLAWFEDESLRVQQLFLRRPGEEVPMLALVAERFAQASCLVTYNGKTFDWPLLRTRFVMNRVACPLPPAHLDLLHCMRRIFKRRLREVSLQRCEVELLGARRERDVGGAEIPGLYLDYLRGADGSTLTPVIEHNGNDLLALAALLAHVGPRFAAPRRDDDPSDHLGYARVAARAEDLERALLFARAAADGGGDDLLTAEALALATKILRRRGDPRAAAELLEERVSSLHGEAAAAVHLLLAKLHEHRLRNPERALEHALRASTAESEHGHALRIRRLTLRLSRPSRGRRRVV